jgi:hypothetical protein
MPAKKASVKNATGSDTTTDNLNKISSIGNVTQ